MIGLLQIKKLRRVSTMEHNKPLVAVGLSLLGWPMGELYTQLMKHYGLTSLSAFESISLMWLKEPNWVLGILGAVGFNFWISLSIYYSTKLWGADYLPLKGMMLAMTSESLLFNIFGIISKNDQLIQNVSGNFVHASAAGLGGLFSSYLIKKYLFKKRPSGKDR